MFFLWIEFTHHSTYVTQIGGNDNLQVSLNNIFSILFVDDLLLNLNKITKLDTTLLPAY